MNPEKTEQAKICADLYFQRLIVPRGIINTALVNISNAQDYYQKRNDPANAQDQLKQAAAMLEMVANGCREIAEQINITRNLPTL